MSGPIRLVAWSRGALGFAHTNEPAFRRGKSLANRGRSGRAACPRGGGGGGICLDKPATEPGILGGGA